jgi:hypothetical protein
MRLGYQVPGEVACDLFSPALAESLREGVVIDDPGNPLGDVSRILLHDPAVEANVD